MKLSLRKKAVNQKIMERRKILEENLILNYINYNNLNLDPYKEFLKELSSLKSGNEKLLFMTNYLENNVKIIDIFSNLFYQENNANLLNDLDKYFLLYIASILDKNIMKRYFPDKMIKENNYIYCKDSPLYMSHKLFEIFFSILFNVKIKDVQVTIINLMLSYSEYSNDFIEYCLNETKYINKLYQITYIDNKEIIAQVGYIFDNIIDNKKCDKNKLEDILKETPLIQRCKELISVNNFNNTLKTSYLELLLSIINKYKSTDYKEFKDCIYIFSNILSSNSKNEEILNLILKINVDLSYDESIGEEIIDKGLGYIFFNILSLPNLQREFTIDLLKIFSNVFYSDKNILYFFEHFEEKFLSVFIRIINTYMHTANEKDSILIKDLLFCLSNLASGPCNVQTIISRSDIPILVLQIMKIKNDNEIYFEGINFFHNLIYNCNKETFANVSELHPFKIYSKALEKTGEPKYIKLYLVALKTLIQKNGEVYHTQENLKNEFYISCIKRKLEYLSSYEDKDISKNAMQILNFFDDKMKTD